MSANVAAPHFVWVKGLRGFEPQKWLELDYGVNDWKRAIIWRSYQITKAEFEALTLDELARRFPAFGKV